MLDNLVKKIQYKYISNELYNTWRKLAASIPFHLNGSCNFSAVHNLKSAIRNNTTHINEMFSCVKMRGVEMVGFVVWSEKNLSLQALSHCGLNFHTNSEESSCSSPSSFGQAPKSMFTETNQQKNMKVGVSPLCSEL